MGLIETNSLEGLIKLHTLGNGTKHGQLELRPAEAGKPLVTLELGATCAIGNKIDVTGTGFLKDGKNEGVVNLVEHLFEERR